MVQVRITTNIKTAVKTVVKTAGNFYESVGNNKNYNNHGYQIYIGTTSWCTSTTSKYYFIPMK